MRAATAGLAGLGMTAGAAVPRRRSGLCWPLGVQLWSVNDQLDRDIEATLATLGRLGFRELELAGLHGRSPAAFAAVAGRYRLRIVGLHHAMADLLADPARCIAQTRDVGATWLVAASPAPDHALAPGVDWLAGMRAAMTLPGWRRNADALGALAIRADAAGLGFAFHNHPFEFAPIDGMRGIDVLLAHTDPALVKWELDVAWAAAGGADPVALLRSQRDRIRLLHVKGLRAAPPPGRYGTDFTTGIPGSDDVIDWPAVFAAARGCVEHVFVEQEPPHRIPVFEALARSRDALAMLE